MKRHLTSRRVAAVVIGVAIATVIILSAVTAQGRSSAPRAHTGTVALGNTALGTILVDARGRTLYLFEKDRNGVSTCDATCRTYWPALTSRGAPRAGRGVQQSLLRLAARNGVRQVTYAGHPLYTFTGDTHAGQTNGEGLTNFGARWDALTANGHKVAPTASSGGYGNGYSPGGGY
jgi:predicted lipoprotein with Yx(FWY)xxD motif